MHGDDFSSTGTESDLRWLDGQLRSKFEIKTDFLGPKQHHLKQVRILNRVISWEEDGINFEADQRHAEVIIKAMNVTKGVSTPGSRDDAARAGGPNSAEKEIREEASQVKAGGEHDLSKELAGVAGEADVEDKELLKEDASQFRALAARANYLAQDRPDIQFAVKEVARRMARPTTADWSLLKRLARYLVVAPRSVTHYYWQARPRTVDTHVDSDWAGCKHTARSTSGGAARLGWHVVKTWSSTQATIALSSGEAELYSLVKGAAQTLGLISLARDFGVQLEGRVHTDASAALGIVNRQGLGKVRHVRVQYLWIQERVRRGELAMKKVPGAENPADLLTKHLAAADMLRHIEDLCVTLHSDRADTAPQLSRVSTVAVDEEKFLRRDGLITFRHERPRALLMTPPRVDGVTPLRALVATRRTRGTFLDDGEMFEIVDQWTSRTSAHEDLGRRWIGSTTFWLRADSRRIAQRCNTQV